MSECAKLAGRLERDDEKCLFVSRKKLFTTSAVSLLPSKRQAKSIVSSVAWDCCAWPRSSRERQRTDSFPTSCRPLWDAQNSSNSWVRETVRNLIRDWRPQSSLRPLAFSGHEESVPSSGARSGNKVHSSSGARKLSRSNRRTRVVLHRPRCRVRSNPSALGSMQSALNQLMQAVSNQTRPQTDYYDLTISDNPARNFWPTSLTKTWMTTTMSQCQDQFERSWRSGSFSATREETNSCQRLRQVRMQEWSRLESLRDHSPRLLIRIPTRSNSESRTESSLLKLWLESLRDHSPQSWFEFRLEGIRSREPSLLFSNFGHGDWLSSSCSSVKVFFWFVLPPMGRGKIWSWASCRTCRRHSLRITVATDHSYLSCLAQRFSIHLNSIHLISAHELIQDFPQLMTWKLSPRQNQLKLPWTTCEAHVSLAFGEHRLAQLSQFMRSWNSSVDLLRRHTLTSVIHITISPWEFCEQPNHFHRWSGMPRNCLHAQTAWATEDYVPLGELESTRWMRTSALLNLVCHGSNLRVVHFLGQDLTATNVWLAFAVFARKIEQLCVQHQHMSLGKWRSGTSWSVDLKSAHGKSRNSFCWIWLTPRCFSLRTCLHRGGCSGRTSDFQLICCLMNPVNLVGPSDRQQDAVAAEGVAASFARQYEIRQESRRHLLSPRIRTTVTRSSRVDNGCMSEDELWNMESWETHSFGSVGSDMVWWQCNPGTIFGWACEQSCGNVVPSSWLATHPQALGAEILDDQELGPFLRTVAQGGYSAGVDVTREGSPPCHPCLEEGVQHDESVVSMAPLGLDPDSATRPMDSEFIGDPGMNPERDTTNSGMEEIEPALVRVVNSPFVYCGTSFWRRFNWIRDSDDCSTTVRAWKRWKRRKAICKKTKSTESILEPETVTSLCRRSSAIKCRRLDESASPSGSGLSHRSPPGLVQKMVEEVKQNTSQASDESVNQPKIGPKWLWIFGSGRICIEFRWVEWIIWELLDGDLDLVNDAKRRDWTSLEHWNFLTQGSHTTEENLKNVSSELQEKFVVAHGSEWEAIWRCERHKWCQLQKLKYPDRVLSSRMVQRRTSVKIKWTKECQHHGTHPQAILVKQIRNLQEKWYGWKTVASLTSWKTQNAEYAR